MVGYIIICYGVCDAICSVGFSPIVRKYGRVPVFSLGFLINLGLNITLTYWTPKPDDLVMFFVISGLWGVADAVWQTQINSKGTLVYICRREFRYVILIPSIYFFCDGIFQSFVERNNRFSLVNTVFMTNLTGLRAR